MTGERGCGFKAKCIARIAYHATVPIAVATPPVI
ncbi:hypothetical protein LMG29542_07595 [Paraburkholderia humisilvae]|uniref:Uncharacterized protein n=1 Tax=Paraburkholderia humisilvae TaxID=627669 RepID=A0A6J5FA78_9BURK|nr:hypothetical protein LMG29542_07595 [Paraburkholderia humisilvae]